MLAVILWGGVQRQIAGGRSLQAQRYDTFKLRRPSGHERRALLPTFAAREMSHHTKSRSHASKAVRNKNLK